MMGDQIVRLNVGGVYYMTTKSTLCQFPESMLGAMFNGSMTNTVDDAGCYFIDRDGELFRYVLNFLRSSQLALADDFKQIDQLAAEADFFQIQPMIKAIIELQEKKRESLTWKGHFLEVIEVRTGSTATMPTNNSRIKTIISGRKDIIVSLPSGIVGTFEKLQHASDTSVTELEIFGSNARLRLAEYLMNCDWQLLDGSMSSSSGYDTKSMISSLIIEQSYRDRWFLPASAKWPAD